MPKGITCPTCQGRLEVVLVTKPATGIVVRYRRCVNPACGGRIKTEERPVKYRQRGKPSIRS